MSVMRNEHSNIGEKPCVILDDVDKNSFNDWVVSKCEAWEYSFICHILRKFLYDRVEEMENFKFMSSTGQGRDGELARVPTIRETVSDVVFEIWSGRWWLM